MCHLMLRVLMVLRLEDVIHLNGNCSTLHA